MSSSTLIGDSSDSVQPLRAISVCPYIVVHHVPKSGLVLTFRLPFRFDHFSKHIFFRHGVCIIVGIAAVTASDGRRIWQRHRIVIGFIDFVFSLVRRNRPLADVFGRLRFPRRFRAKRSPDFCRLRHPLSPTIPTRVPGALFAASNTNSKRFETLSMQSSVVTRAMSTFAYQLCLGRLTRYARIPANASGIRFESFTFPQCARVVRSKSASHDSIPKRIAASFRIKSVVGWSKNQSTALYGTGSRNIEKTTGNHLPGTRNCRRFNKLFGRWEDGLKCFGINRDVEISDHSRGDHAILRLARPGASQFTNPTSIGFQHAQQTYPILRPPACLAIRLLVQFALPSMVRQIPGKPERSRRTLRHLRPRIARKFTMQGRTFHRDLYRAVRRIDGNDCGKCKSRGKINRLGKRTNSQLRNNQSASSPVAPVSVPTDVGCSDS